jgi:hypothetical protein
MPDRTPTTTGATVIYIDAGDPKICGIAYGGLIFEAYDIYTLGAAVGQQVLADYLPSARQWCVVAIVV